MTVTPWSGDATGSDAEPAHTTPTIARSLVPFFLHARRLKGRARTRAHDGATKWSGLVARGQPSRLTGRTLSRAKRRQKGAEFSSE